MSRSFQLEQRQKLKMQTVQLLNQIFLRKKYDRTQIEEVLQKLTGEIVQIPPMYSAVKVNGRKLYEYARKGQTVERPERTVSIHELELISPEQLFEGTEITFQIRIACGKGTYIRTLAVQIGELLGFPAHMASLVRTASGTYRKPDCRTLAEIKELMENGEIETFLSPLEDALTDYLSVEIDEEVYTKILNGQVLPEHPTLQTEEYCRIYKE